MRVLTNPPELPEREIDLLVVGAGPAGIACGLQAWRDGLDVLVLGNEPVGGLVRAARRLTNLPGLHRISGQEYAGRLERHVEQCGLPFVIGHVTGVAQHQRDFAASLTDGRVVRTRTLCLAVGTRPRDLPCPAGAQPIDRDVRGLPADLGGSSLIVIGGGDAALDSALSCLDRGARVTVLVRGAALAAAPHLQREVEERGFPVRFHTSVTGIAGGQGDWSIRCGQGETLRAGYVVVCIGREPRNELLQGLLPVGFAACVLQENAPGLFLAGDLIRGRERYVATALGDGQRAAVAARICLDEARA